MRSKLATLLLASVVLLGLTACETAQTKPEATTADAGADSERCMLTGSRLPRANCRDAGVGAISRDSFERSMSDRPSQPPALPGR